MKYLLLLFVIPFSSYGQITDAKKVERKTIGAHRILGDLVAELSYSVLEGDTTYYFTYKNAKYTKITDIQTISFKGAASVNGLYDYLMSVFKDENKKNKEYEVVFTIGETNVIIKNARFLGAARAMLYTSNGYVYLLEKEINKIFGKKSVDDDKPVNLDGY